MSDILDLIDGAIDAHELSADAMRWTAVPQDEVKVPGIHEWMIAHLNEQFPLTDWQAMHLSTWYDIRPIHPRNQT